MTKTQSLTAPVAGVKSPSPAANGASSINSNGSSKDPATTTNNSSAKAEHKSLSSSSKPATNQAGNPSSASATPATSATTGSSSASTSSASTSSTLGPGPRRFRGDVPAFNPSSQSPHLYNQQMHQYSQPPGLQPLYPNQHPQYFSQQPQFIPYGGLMMPYYPVTMGYPDYTMYQPYQYYAMPGTQFQNPLAYMQMNGMANGAGNGYIPNRKKHFKPHNNNYNNYNNYHSSHQNNSHHTSSSHNTNSAAGSDNSGGSQPVHSKHISSSVPASSSITETTEMNILDDKDSSERTLDVNTLSKDGDIQDTELKQADDVLDDLNSKTAPAPVDENNAVPRDQVSSATPVIKMQGLSTELSLPRESNTKPPVFFDISLEEFLKEKAAISKLSQKLVELKLVRIKNLIDSDLRNDFHVDTNRKFLVIDHSADSREEKMLGDSLPKSLRKTDDNGHNDKSAPKPVLNWASLLQSTVKKTQKAKTPVSSNGSASSLPLSSSTSAIPTLTDRYQSLGLLVMSILYNPAFDLNTRELFPLKPRGLTNTGNICYMNAVLQCLLFCGPFNKVLRLIEEKAIGLLGKTSMTPVLDASIEFMRDFSNVSATTKLAGSSVNGDGIVVGRPLSPEKLFLKLIESPKFQHLKWGQQEDAEEFLVYMLDGLHEDFVRAEAKVTLEQIDQLATAYGQKLDGIHAEDLRSRMRNAYGLLRAKGSKTSEKKTESESEKTENGWSEVGVGRKVSSKRVSEVEPSPITSIFGGRFRSVLNIPKSKESHSITIDPYRCILLDISLESVQTIEDALWKLSEMEKLPYKNEDGIEVVAQKQTYIEDLPEILTLQLKRFSFQQKQEAPADPNKSQDDHISSVGRIEKILKHVSYGLELTVPLESLSPASRNVQSRVYLLTGVIYHHGRKAEGGHYTCDVLREESKWLRIDDTAVEAIDEDAVIETPEAKDKSAYIFIYQRKNTPSIQRR